MIKHLFTAEIYPINGSINDTRHVVITHYGMVDAIKFMRDNGFIVKSITIIAQTNKDDNIGWVALG